jgi:hypothetical protein
LIQVRHNVAKVPGRATRTADDDDEEVLRPTRRRRRAAAEHDPKRATNPVLCKK